MQGKSRLPLFFTLLLCVFSLNLFAARISGNVLDEINNELIIGIPMTNYIFF